MNKLSSIILLLLMFFKLGANTIIIGNFIWNQSEIAQLFCINKEKPKMQCNGKCHLAKTLQQNNKTENTDLELIKTPADAIAILVFSKVLNTYSFTDRPSFTLKEQVTPIYHSIKLPPPKYLIEA